MAKVKPIIKSVEPIGSTNISGNEMVTLVDKQGNEFQITGASFNKTFRNRTAIPYGMASETEAKYTVKKKDSQTLSK